MSQVFGRSILVVDDNLALAENIAEMLALEGFRTAVAGTAEEALPQALSAEVACLVTDFRLPGIDGAELVSRVRVERADVRFIVMSGHTDEYTQRRSEEAGATFVSKPVDLRVLTRLIRLGGPTSQSGPANTAG
jgi:DNA-binding response OmpR family regulator